MSRLVIEDATYRAVSYFNDGNTSAMSMLCELKLTPGHFTIGGLHKADDMRIYFAKRKRLKRVYDSICSLSKPLTRFYHELAILPQWGRPFCQPCGAKWHRRLFFYLGYQHLNGKFLL